MKFLPFVAAALVMSLPANAASTKQQATAPNGVVLTVYADDFADNYEYSSPDVDIPGTQGKAWVSRTKKQGTWSEEKLVAYISYRGDWRYFNGAILRGGEALTTIEGGRDVVSCANSRYGSGCLLSEVLLIEVTPDQIARHAVDGKLALQLSASRGSDIVLEVPVSYFEALRLLSSPAS